MPFQQMDLIGSGLTLPFRWLATRLLLMLSPVSCVDGFDVIRVDDQNERVMCDRLAEALLLIRQVDAKRFIRIRRDVRRILIVRSGGPEYWPLADGFVLDSLYVANAPIERIALSIVHEAVHARLWKMGVDYRSALRSRIEKLCVHSEIAFASQLPQGGVLLEQARAKLANPWWTEQRVFERRLAAMRKSGWPEWLLRPYRAIFGPNQDS